MITIGEYLEKEGISLTAFCREFRLNYITINKAIQTGRLSAPALKRLKEATNGQFFCVSQLMPSAAEMEVSKEVYSDILFMISRHHPEFVSKLKRIEDAERAIYLSFAFRPKPKSSTSR